MTIHIYHQINRNPNTLSYYEDDLKNISTSYKPQIYLPKVNFSSFYLFNAVGLKVKCVHQFSTSTSNSQNAGNFIIFFRQLLFILLFLMAVLYVFIQFYAVFDLLFPAIRDYYSVVDLPIRPTATAVPVLSEPTGSTTCLMNTLNEVPQVSFRKETAYHRLFVSHTDQHYYKVEEGSIPKELDPVLWREIEAMLEKSLDELD